MLRTPWMTCAPGWRHMAEIEQQWRLSGHAQRAGVDHQIETALAVIESNQERMALPIY